MRCRVSFKELSLYLDGKHKGARRRELDRHIDECPVCRQQLNQLRLMKESLSGLTPIKESEGFDFEFNRLLQERLSAKGSFLRRLIKRIKEILSGARDTFVYPVPVAVRIAASFILIAALTLGARAGISYKVPFVEFVAGDVKIYEAAKKRWVPLKTETRLKTGDKIHSVKGAIFNIVSRGKYKARVKDNSIIVLARVDSGWRDIDTDFDISYGNLLVNTAEGFKGSKMKIYTPSCDAEVAGTAFIIKALGKETWLGVLEGKVKVVSKAHPLKAEAIRKTTAYVSSGQKILVKPYEHPTVPELFSEKEWRSMQELYQLTQEPKIILLIGTGSDRIEELLGPRPVYISGIGQAPVPKGISEKISAIVSSVQAKDYKAVTETAKRLETLLKEHPDPAYDVEILMFIASYYHHIGDYEDAIRVFGEVIEKHSGSQLASLAQCAVATIYLKDLRDTDMARTTYMKLLEAYPDSADAIRAKETLSSLR